VLADSRPHAPSPRKILLDQATRCRVTGDALRLAFVAAVAGEPASVRLHVARRDAELPRGA